MMRSINSAVAALLVLACLGSAAAAQTVTIAVGGDAPPDGNGTFSLLLYPVLNDSGQAAFRAYLAGTSGGTTDDRGIYIGDGIDLAQVARGGQALADGSGTFSSFLGPVLNGSGQAAFKAYLADTSNPPYDTSGIFRGSGLAMTQIERAGQSAPDGNGKFSYFSSQLALNDLGQAAFMASLIDTSGGSSDNDGIFRGSGGAVTQIAREGQAAPDGNGTFGEFEGLALNGAGQAAFWASLLGTSGGSTDNEGIFRGSGGTITRIVRRGQAAPDGNGTFWEMEDPGLNDSGQAAFKAWLVYTSGGNSDDYGIFRGSGGTITQIARGGQPSPDGNGTFFGFSEPALNDSGQAAFWASLLGTSGGHSDDYGIFRGSGGSITQIVRRGQAAPDGNGTVSGFSQPALNDSGHAAFKASLLGTSGGTSDDYGIFVGDGIDLVQAARKGQALAGSTITDLSFEDGPADECSGLNNLAQVAYRAELADGREVVALFTPALHWRTGGSGDFSSSSNWTLGIAPAALYDVLIDPAGSLNVTGHHANTTVKSLTVGSTGGGLAALYLNNGGDLTAVGTVTVTSGGKIEVGAGRVLSAAALSNSGVLTGDGMIQAALTNQAAGEVRVSTGRQLVFAGSGHTNAGVVEVIGGEVEFTGALTNAASTGLITGRNAALRFGPQLTNDGSVALSFGTSDLHGDIDNAATGQIIVSGNSQATFYDDVSNSGVIQVSAGSTAVFFGVLAGSGVSGGGDVFLEGDTRPGASAGLMSFGGNVTFGTLSSLDAELGGISAGSDYDQVAVAGQVSLGGTLAVSLLGGFLPEPGDVFEIVTCGSRSGEFASATGLDDLGGHAGLDFSLGYALDGVELLAVAHKGDANLDAEVDVLDLAIMANNFGATGTKWRHADFNRDAEVDVLDLAIMANNFGWAEAGGGEAVPEPATLSLLAVVGLALMRRRRT